MVSSRTEKCHDKMEWIEMLPQFVFYFEEVLKLLQDQIEWIQAFVRDRKNMLPRPDANN